MPHSLVIVATNAGEIGSWQEKWRDIAQQSDRWHFSVLHEPAPWVSEDDLAESRLRNPPHRYKRLWQCIWSAGDGDGLDPADIDACQTLERMPGVRRDRIYIAALDLGVKHDHSALCVLAANPVVGVVELASVQSWRPEDFGGAVD